LPHVVVTGATGFLGKRLVKKLLHAGNSVRCLLRPSSDVTSVQDFVGPDHVTKLSFTALDLLDVQATQQALDRAAVLYHCAAEMKGDLATLMRNNVETTQQVLHAAHVAQVPRVVLISSLGVYGSGSLAPGSTLDETCPLETYPKKRDNYTYSKVKQEEAIWQAQQEHDVPVVVIRPGVIFGPGRGALSTRMGLHLGGTFWCFGNRTLPYVYVDNVADAILQAGQTDNAIGQAFNIVDDALPTSRDVLAAYQQHGKPVKLAQLPTWGVAPLTWTGKLSKYTTQALWNPLVFSNTMAKTVLRWQPVVPMAEALRRAIVNSES
jgi:nucleoside-diphosphate-sugar epimerase